MDTVDNSITPPVLTTISGPGGTITIDTGHASMSREFACIMCTLSFYVGCQNHTSNRYDPKQTLFCPECFKILKKLFHREKTGDYGW